MNMQAMLKQAQNMQRQMMNEQEKINNSTFYGENGLVKVTMKGTKRIEKVEIQKDDDFSKDDLEMLEDMVMVAVNDALNQIDKETEEKLGKYTKGLPGLF
jgi:DNA-binding YbaB/EbfC family protein